VLKALRESFDYIVVDTAPAFDEQTLTALDETDECVIVATLDVPTLKNVKVALETLEMLDIARDHRHLLLNRADDNVGLGAERVESILGMPVASMVETSMDIAAATNAGQPIMIANPSHSFSKSLTEFSTRLTGEPVAPSSSPARVATDDDQAERAGRLFRRKK
jgi:pilus assembly protein CpaE